MENTTGKTILLISSHVVRGCVGSRASAFVLERMGFSVWSLLTVTMTWQPRHGPAHQLHVSDEDFAALCADIAASPFAQEINGVMTGYFVSPAQVSQAARLIHQLKTRSPDIPYLCDPVMGDEGGLYIASETAQAIRAELLPIADIIKPNRSELEWICGYPLDNHQAIIAALGDYKAATKLVTSAPARGTNATGNLLIDGDMAWLAEHPLVAEPVNGLGDLTASLFFSHILQNMAPPQALAKTTAAVFDCLQDTLEKQANELCLSQAQHFFTHPTSSITLTSL